MSLRRFLRGFYRPILRTAIYLGFLLLSGVLKRLGFPRARRIGRGIGTAVYRFFQRERALSRKQIGIALPDLPSDERDRILKESFRHLGESAVELLYAEEILKKGRIEVEGLDALEKARSETQGVIVATGHFGNWELMALTIARAGYPVTVIARRVYDHRLDGWMRGFRKRFGIETIVREDPRAGFKVLRALKKGSLAGILFDLDTQVESVVVPFFGRPARTPIAPVQLALRGTPLFFGVIRRTAPLSHRIRFVPVKVESLEEGLTKLNELLEEEIRIAPEQWIWFQPRWRGITGY
jgi:KDO2-lipid IV(A) lauroyltransferase